MSCYKTEIWRQDPSQTFTKIKVKMYLSEFEQIHVDPHVQRDVY